MTADRFSLPREIAIRVALGAASRSVVWLVVRQTLVSTLVGTAIGLGSAATATRVLTSMVYGVTPLDPATFALAVFVLVSLGVAAAWVPARRAASADPLIALKGA